MEENVFYLLCSAYRQAYKTDGAHKPITVELRQIIVRHFQRHGQTAIIEINREFARGAVERSTTEQGQLKSFVHPKAAAAAKKVVAVVNPGSPTAEQIKPGRMQRHMKAALTGDLPHPLTKPETEVLEPLEAPDGAGKVVAADDETLTPMTDDESQMISSMSPGEIVSTYGEPWIMAKLTAHGVEIKGGENAKKLAAMLKAKAK